MLNSYGQIAKPTQGQKQGWFYIELDKDFANYYKWFYSRSFKTWYPPMNGCHITFIAGEKDDRIVQYNEIIPYLNKDINFQYENEIYTNGRAFWIPCASIEIDNIRKTLGLNPKPWLHITLGNVKNQKD